MYAVMLLTCYFLLQSIPYLIAMSSDYDARIRFNADQQLKEIDKANPTYIQVIGSFATLSV